MNTPAACRRRRRGSHPLAAEPLEARRLLAGDLPGGVDLVLPAADGPAAIETLGLARQVEYLTRGVNASYLGSNRAYVDWRLLGTDPGEIAFNLYRQSGAGTAVKRNATPLTTVTNFVDTGLSTSQPTTYFVRPVIDGVEGEASEPFTLPARPPVQQHRSVPLQIPAGGVTPLGDAYSYSANDATAADLDGDGVYELIVKWDPSNAKDNSQSGYTGNVYLDGYKLDGTLLWRIDLGRNIRAGAHYTQFIAYDFDGDGRAELAVKTAPGTIDGTGEPVLLGSDRVTDDYRNNGGTILAGPEYLTVFDGLTGANLVTTAYTPARGNVSDWGDSYGNRVDRFLAGVAYLDGQRPSLIMARGYYTRTVLAAWDFRDGELSQRWVFDTGSSSSGPLADYMGQGNHNMAVGDVDGDGRDEIVYGSMTVDDDGQGLYSTGLGHGDALYLGDLIPDRPGLEVFGIHESQSAHQGKGGTLRDAATGEVIAFVPGSGDVGRGSAMDLDPAYPGVEIWTSGDGGLYAADGTRIQDKPSNMFINFGIWWDGDPLRELLDGTVISDFRNGGRYNLVFAPAGLAANNSTKKTPALVADLYGDWREEVVWRTSDSSELQIWSTTISSDIRLPTLMHDVLYRESVAGQNVGYNQPTNTSFFIGAGMAMPGQPDVFAALPNDPPVLVAAGATASTVIGTGVTLLAEATDDGGDAGLAYTWALAAGPTGVTFTENGSNAARRTSVIFEAAGEYRFSVTVADRAGRSTSGEVAVTVLPTPSGLRLPVDPVLVAVDSGQAIPAWIADQFGQPLASQAGVSWELIAGEGGVDAAGVFTAGSEAGFATVRFGFGPAAHEIPVTIVAAGFDRLPIQVEAGSYGGGVLRQTEHAGSSGTGYLNFPGTGGFAEIAALDGGSGGPQALLIRYALGAATARTGSLIVNGESRPVSFEPTGSWTSWNTLAVPAELNAGATNTIRFESTGEDLANLDLIWPAALPEPAATETLVTVGDGEIVVETEGRGGSLPLVKDGAGTFVLTAPATLSGGVRMTDGMLVVQSVDALGSGGLTVSGGEVRLEVGYDTVVLDRLELAGGQLDLGTGRLTVAAGGYDLAAVREWLVAGRNGGGWDGATGIVSRAAGSSVLREVGYTVSDGLLTIGWAAAGDTNLDGAVNIFDMMEIVSRGRFNDGDSGAAWADGDFDFDGRVGLVDLVQSTSSGLFNAASYRFGAGTGPETGLAAAGGSGLRLTAAAFALLAAEAEGEDKPGFI